MKKIFIGKNHACDLDYTYRSLKIHLASVGKIVENVSDADYIVFPSTCAGTLNHLQIVMGYMLSILSKKKEGALTFVTGCITRNINNPKLSAAVQKFLDDNFDYVFSEDNFDEIVNIIAGERIFEPDFGACFFYKNMVEFYISRGCNNHCSFCKMQYQDISTKSVKYEEFKEDLDNLTSDITLANLYGTNISQYGIDGDYEHNLCDLVSLLEETPTIKNINLYGFAFRDAIKNDFARELKNISKLRRIKGSVETGSPRLLSMMNKGYTVDELVEFWKEINENHPRILDTDIIVGFPTETDEDIKLTLQLLEELNPVRVQLHRYQNSFLIPSSKFEQLSDEEIMEHYKVYKRELGKRVY